MRTARWIAAAAGVLAWVVSALPGLAWGGDEPGVMDAVAWGQVDQIRQRLHATDEDLAALGCTQESAETILTALKTWYGENRADLEPLLRHTAARALQQAIQRSGTADAVDEQRIQTLRQAAAQAAAQERELMDAAAARVRSLLSEEQREAWNLLRRNGPSLKSCRFAPNLTREQRRDIETAYRTYQAACAEAKTEAEALTAKTTLDETIARILTYDQKTCVERAEANLRRCSEGVVAASREILPVPEQLLTDHVAQPEPPPQP